MEPDMKCPICCTVMHEYSDDKYECTNCNEYFMVIDGVFFALGPAER